MRYTRGVLHATLALSALAAVQAPGDLATGIPPARRADRVAVITIKGPIDGITLQSVERRVARAREAGADAIVLELDTPGGEMKATLDLCRLVKSECPPNTVAWVNPQAYSAGAILALAARRIIVHPSGVFGDAAPIQAIPGVGMMELPAAERAKLESPLLSEVIDSARRNHVDEQLVQAFVAVGVELWMLEDVQTGERVFVDRAEYRAVFGDDPPQTLTAATPPAASAPVKVRPRFTDLFQRLPNGAGAPPPPDSADRKARLEMEQSLPPSRPMLGAADRARWRLVTQIDSADRLLTLRAAEGMAAGLVDSLVADDRDLARYFGASRVDRYDETWSEELVWLLMSMPVRLVLVAVMIICFLVELAVPGFGIFGVVATLCLAVLVGTPFLVGLANWWQLVLMVGGLLMVALELVVLPGTLILGICGVVAILVGIGSTFVTSEFSTPAGQRELISGIAITFGVAVASSVVGGWLLRRLGGPWFMRRLVLQAEVAGVGMVSAAEADAMGGGGAGGPAGGPVVGSLGVAITSLRPAGKGEFNGRPYDVRSVDGFLDSGAAVRVVRRGPAEFEVEAVRE